MMRILLILLFISFNSYSQTYEDIMSINSIDIFKKVCIENDYEFHHKSNNLRYTDYAWNLYRGETRSDDIAGIWSTYNEISGYFYFIFYLENDSAKNRYYSIVDGIKNRCKFYKIINDNSYGKDVATYSCFQSLYSGKIGFFISDGFGYVIHYPKGNKELD